MSQAGVSEPHATGEAQEGKAPRTRPRWVGRLIRFVMGGGALALLGVALVIVGFVAGWTTATYTVVANAENPDPEIVEVPVSTVSDDVLMPDVRGLDPDSATQVLADAGVDVSSVVVVERPAAGESGLVIEQIPAFGTERPRDVELVVSAPATVPDVVGQDEAAAMTVLRELSARIDRAGVYLPGQPIGVVVSIDPAPGAPLPAGVTLTVTEAPGSIEFADLDASGSCDSTSTVDMDGQEWAPAVTCSSSSSGRTGTWRLDGAVDAVSGTVGIVDGSAPGSSVRVELLVNGHAAQSFDLASGMSRQFDLRIPDAATFGIRVTSLSGSANIAIGDFVGLGTVSEIDDLR